MPNVVVGCDSSPGQTEEASDQNLKRDRQERPTDPDGKQRATIAGSDPSDQQVGNDVNERRTAEDGELACSDLAEKWLEDDDAHWAVQTLDRHNDEPDNNCSSGDRRAGPLSQAGCPIFGSLLPPLCALWPKTPGAARGHRAQL
jgi:hypothetical protein